MSPGAPPAGMFHAAQQKKACSDEQAQEIEVIKDKRVVVPPGESAPASRHASAYRSNILTGSPRRSGGFHHKPKPASGAISNPRFSESLIVSRKVHVRW